MWWNKYSEEFVLYTAAGLWPNHLRSFTLVFTIYSWEAFALFQSNFPHPNSKIQEFSILWNVESDTDAVILSNTFLPGPRKMPLNLISSSIPFPHALVGISSKDILLL